MSTNPFRKHSSLKGPSGNPSPKPNSTSDARGISPGGLSLDTRVPNTSQKHVNFASPPAIPISPVSYPPSPETTRQDSLSAFSSPQTSYPLATDYRQALASDPFAAEAFGADDDGTIEQALENARANNELTTAALVAAQTSKENVVKGALGRVASAPRRPMNNQPSTSTEEQSTASRSTLGVDAFKRMLLTGDRGPASVSDNGIDTNASRKHDDSSADLSSRMAEGLHNQEKTPPLPGLQPSGDAEGQSGQAGPNPVSDSGSSADTASTSQHSIFETVQPTHDDSPRTSDELDVTEARAFRAGLGIIAERREKPPLPRSRRGKPLQEVRSEQGPTAKFDDFINSLSLPSSRNISSKTQSLRSPGHNDGLTSDHLKSAEALDTQKKTPPAVPLSRRKSQQAPKKPVLARSSSSRYSVFSETEGPLSPHPTNSSFKAPPPPPARRSNSSSGRRPSIDVVSIPEEADVSYLETRPGLAQTPSYQKRMSQGLPPPIPPPRRGWGSSRGSMENPRPSMASLGLSETGESRSSTPSRDRQDILADIAALQREVDAARAGAGQ